MKLKIYINIALLVLLASGCTVKSVALHTMVDIFENGMEVFYEEGDVDLAREAMGSQLKLLEVLLKSDPYNRKLLLMASQGYGGYSFLFLEEENKKRAKDFYKRGRDFGLRHINKITEIDLLTETDLGVLKRALTNIKQKDVPLLFWTAYSWAGLSNLSRNSPQALLELPKVEMLMKKVNELQSDYFYGGVDLFLGAYYGSRPRMFGGDLKKSKRYFQKAIRVSDRKFLMGSVLYAKYYAGPAQEKDLYESLLKRVLSIPVLDFPEQKLSNQMAKIRAKKLLEDIDELFEE